MPTYLELKAQHDQLVKQMEEVRQEELASTIADIKEKIAAYNLTAADLGFGSKSSTKKSKATSSTGTAKFRGPNGELWTGMGRQPAWMKEAIEKGSKKEEFSV